ncbi:hypothetical protein BS47DRAFT_219443 [Hydnum rufescens UP504]|uniref:Uncharacterized protein n=1 Tax=Hydnum rufescens UP504 TaxID=1448309 RepID=A0A9P6DP10_9AGAM|nr:hypothetical protein BS47DRAFT_219443 [Hydnum rufescens UP504]
MLPPLVIPSSPLSSAQEGPLGKTHVIRASHFYLPSPSSPNTKEAMPRSAGPQQHYPSRDQPLPWYLRPSWTASEVIIDAHGQLKAGTVRSLIEGLTMNEPNVSQDVFLLTYPTFMSAASVVDLLAERYEMGEPRGLSQDEFEKWKTRKLWPVQSNVLNVITSWLMGHHMIELGSTVVDGVKQFLQLIRSHPKNETVAKRLLKTIDSMVDDRHCLPSPVSALSSPIKTKRSYLIWRRPQKVDFITLNPTEVAQQLTLMEYRLYNEIRPSELLTWSSCQDQLNPKVRNLARFLHFNKCIAKFVALSIFSASESPRRDETISHFLQVAEMCRTLGNFSTVESTIAGIHAGFSPSPSEDLENIQLVEPRLEELRTLVSADSNYSGLRAAYQGLSGSCVPFIGQCLSVNLFPIIGTAPRLL